MWSSSSSQLPLTTRDVTLGKRKSKRRLYTLTLINFAARFYTLLNFIILSTGTFYINYTEQSPFAFTFYCILALIAFYNLTKNWYLFSKVPLVNYSSMELRFCQMCARDVPLKSDHCVLCGNCVVQKDHHCFFLGGCVDKFNINYFTRFCFHASWTCFIALYYFVGYSCDNYKTIWTQDVVYYMIPLSLVKFVMKEVTIFQLYLVVACNLSFATAMFTLVMFIYQSYYNPESEPITAGFSICVQRFCIMCNHFCTLCITNSSYYFLRIKRR